MAATDIYYKKWVEMNLGSAADIVYNAAKIAEMDFVLSVLNSVTPSLTGYPAGTSLSASQTGNGDSTHTFDYGNDGSGGDNFRQGALLRITTTVLTTPTCTYAIEGSVDNTNFSALEFSDSATPTTFGNSTFVLTTATTVMKYIKPAQKWRYLKVVYSLNTNVTNTADLYALGDLSMNESELAALKRKHAATQEPAKRNELAARLRAHGHDPDAAEAVSELSVVPAGRTSNVKVTAEPTKPVVSTEDDLARWESEGGATEKKVPTRRTRAPRVKADKSE